MAAPPQNLIPALGYKNSDYGPAFSDQSVSLFVQEGIQEQDKNVKIGH